MTWFFLAVLAVAVFIGVLRLDNHTVAWANDNSILCHITQ